tara:strand:+ start:287 stop:844 length:558 start_codon:yes stop_codon:yes gene_type:complete
MSGQVSCPKGCGDLEYKNERPGKAIFLFVVGAISLIAAVYELLFDGDLFLPFMFGVVGLWVIYYGFSVGKLSRLKCGVCKGVLIETKQIDDLLKDDAYYFRKRLGAAKNTSSYDCPDCNEKMRRFTITARQKTDYTSVGGFVVSALSMDKIKEIDGCSMCDLLWLDVDEEGLLSNEGHNIIRNSL